MDAFVASLLSTVLRLQNVMTAFVLAAFAGVAFRAFLRAALGERVRPPSCRRKRAHWSRAAIFASHLAWGAMALGAGALYGVFVVSAFELSAFAVLVAGLTLVVVLGSLVSERILGWSGPGGLTGALLRAVMALSLVVLALITLMRAGFLSLTEDRPVLLVQLTGATSEEDVQWTPPGDEPRAERLRTHQVVFLRPADGAFVGETWVYGDEIAVKGRVLRLSPILNAAGIPNLFTLEFAFNGYNTRERHNTYPHRAVALETAGPLAVHPLWRRTQERLINLWESGTDEGSAWMIRSTTKESTFFPLVDESGRAVKRTYRLVLTPGGLSAS
ncbi:MAG: hypothetical protein JXO72_03860 [Vicinamibacteria bacterium]|nr:hypothetical protein [Vicinamibacteria bacterium]